MSLFMSQRRLLLNFLNQNVTLIQRSSSNSRNKNATSAAVIELKERKQRSSSGQKATPTQVRTIKKLHKENKALFGELIETKQEKVKRTRKEVKLIKQLTSVPDVKEKRRSSKKALQLPSSALMSENHEGFEASRSVGQDDDEVNRTLNLLSAMEQKRRGGHYETSYLNPRSLPRASAVRLEHAGVSINKHRIVEQDAAQDKNSNNVMGKSSSTVVVRRAHKGAEIEWAMRNAPTKIKLIELSPSSSSTTIATSASPPPDHGDNACQVLDEQGHSTPLSRTASLPIEDAERKRVGVGSIQAPPSSSPFSLNNPRSISAQQKKRNQNEKEYMSPEQKEQQDSESLPTVEQLINSFYETDNSRQLRPNSETRKMFLSTTKSYSSSKTPDQEGYPHNPSSRGMDFNERPQKNKTDDQTYDGPLMGAEVDVSASTSDIFIPYYNPDRNYGSDIETPMDNDVCGTADNIKSSESTIITSFPYPFSFSKNRHEAGKTPPASDSTTVSSPKFLSSSLENNAVEEHLNSQNELPPSSPVQPSVKLPSVSKILNATMPEEQALALKRWEQRMIAQMGEQGFRQYKESILTNGKLLHSNIERYLRGTPTEEIVIAEPNQGHWNSLNAVLASVDHVHVLESHVIHPKLQYCGVIDCVAEFRNRLVLIDWKTSQKPKPFVSMTYDTPLQIAAYIGAINYDRRYSVKINDGLIVIAYEDGSSCQTFLLSSMEVEKYWNLWLKRLQLFRKMNATL